MNRSIGAQLIDPAKKIYTRSGWEIPQVAKLPRNPKLVGLQSKISKQWRQNPEIRSTSNFPYNCVGMVFASRRAYIEIDHVLNILKYDYYKRIERSMVMVGDVVLYKNEKEITHVGLIVQVSTLGSTKDFKVLSKWGEEGEFLHFLEDVPEPYGETTEFYTERFWEEQENELVARL